MTRAGRRPPSHRRPAALPESMLDLIWILLFFFLMISTIRRDDPTQSVLVDTVPILDGQYDPGSLRTAAQLTVAADGTFRLGDEPLVRDYLMARLTKLVQEPASVDTLILTVDRQARVEDLLAAEDAARVVGLTCLVRRQSLPAATPEATRQ